MPSVYEEQPMGLVEFDFDRVKILHRSLTPADIRGRVSPGVQALLARPAAFIERSCEELELETGAGPPRPYWCPRLRASRSERVRLFRRLASLGLVQYRFRIKAE
eukprot:279938-Lingulodinium_polyedra.AAC.1